jgi:hypothetical protein
MTRQILNRLNQTLENHRELQTFRGRWPDNLIDTADRIVDHDIPNTLNKMLKLLNFLNNEDVFNTESKIEELQELFQNQQNSLDYLFEQAENNKDIIVTNLSKAFNTSIILDTLKTGFISHCDTITLTLTAAKIK